MRFEGFLRRWVGVGLTLIGAVATIWLTVVGKLNFYIHPRYTVFTVSLAVVAVIIAVSSIALTRTAQNDHHSHEDAGHDHDAADPGSTGARAWGSKALTGLRGVLLVTAFLALLIVPPATLSATMRQSRDLVTSGTAIDSGSEVVLAGADPSSFTVKDWSALLREGGRDAVLGQTLEVSGYILDRGEGDVFYLVRLTMTCCAVDAQPIGVPVYQPGWRDQFKPSDWVQVKGTFAENPDRTAKSDTVVAAKTLMKITEPAQPYVF